MKEITTYKDYLDRETELTAEELSWFHEVIDKAKTATGYTNVRIIAYDHELVSGHEEALGICSTSNPNDSLSPESDTYISIDNYFIDECYNAVFFKKIKITPESIEEVMAHELAHLKVWRHGKRHSKETRRLLEQIAPEQVIE